MKRQDLATTALVVATLVFLVVMTVVMDGIG